jgi:hypothetical protein
MVATREPHRRFSRQHRQAHARVLVAAGIPDQAVEVRSEVCVFDSGTEIRTEELSGRISYRSLEAMAETTFEEGDRPLHRARFKERPQIAFPLQPGAPEMRFTPSADVVVIPEPGPAFLGRRRCVSRHRNFEPARQDQRFCCSNCRLRAHRAAISRSDQPGRQAQSTNNTEIS